MKRTLGPWVAQWIERHLPHGPGDVQGQPIHLDADEVRYIFRCYEIDDTGRRVVKRAVRSRAKGRRKSEIAGAICCAEALGPVRFAGWGKNGYPLAMPVTYPFVRICATEEGQSGNTYDNVVFMLREGPLRETPGLDVGLTRTFIPGGGEIVPSTASAASKDGGKESHCCFDETHLYVPSQPELIGMHKTVSRNLTKRLKAEPWAQETTTMFEPGLDSIAERAFNLATRLEKAGTSDPSFLFDHHQGPKVTDWDDDEELTAALTAAYGEAASWQDLGAKIAELRRGDATRTEFQRFYLNQPAGAADLAFCSMEDWDAMAVSVAPDELVPPGSSVCLGVDGSRGHDQAVIAHAALADQDGVIRGDLVVLDAVPRRLPDPPFPHVVHHGRIDYTDVGDQATDRFRRFRVREAAYGTDYVEGVLQVIDRRLPKERIAKIGRTSLAEKQALAALDEVLSSKRFRHRGDPVLRRQIANTLVVRDPVSKTILRLRPRKESEPIHAVYALAFAVWRAARINPVSVYEGRGFREIDGVSDGGIVPPAAINIADDIDRYKEILGGDADG